MKKVSQEYLLLFFSLFILSLRMLTYINFSVIYYRIIELLSIAIFVYYTILYITKYKKSKFVIALTVYIICQLISSFFGKYGVVEDCIKIYYPILGFCIICDIYITKNLKNLVSILNKIFFTLITINTLTILMFPGGMYSSSLYDTNWFFGYDNIHCFVYFPALLFCYLDNKYNKKNYILSVLLLIFVSFSVYYCFSANTVFAYSIFLIYICLYKFINKMSIFNSVTYFATYLSVFFGIVVLRLQHHFKFIIVSLLHRDLTFTGRTIIWDKVLNFIAQKPLLGYGREYNDIFVIKMGNIYYTHAHNTIYDILYKGGIVSLVVFMYMIIISIINLFKNRSNDVTKFIAFILFLLLLMMNFESRQELLGTYIILLFGFRVEDIIKNKEVNEAKNLEENE